ncbi:unnamed protein product [Chrysodeixis includens]|uniref:Uncharacterized protein n=1 Tax=Chrysodeixis includens TaxID=689277 RepID=A0A9N8KRS4_CHRIL|nr:unnamed protein product [Chrysodeixis includens]
MAPYLKSTVDGVLPARRLSSLQLAYSVAKKARKSRGAAAAAGATSHHRIQQRATCACVRDGSTERTGALGGAARARRGRGAAPPRPPPANDDVITAPRPPRAPRPPPRALPPPGKCASRRYATLSAAALPTPPSGGRRTAPAGLSSVKCDLAPTRPQPQRSASTAHTWPPYMSRHRSPALAALCCYLRRHKNPRRELCPHFSVSAPVSRTRVNTRPAPKLIGIIKIAERFVCGDYSTAAGAVRCEDSGRQERHLAADQLTAFCELLC